MKRGLIISIILLGVIAVVILLRLTITGWVGTGFNVCEDTDMGKNYGIKGEIRYGINEATNIKEDKCLNQNILLEYYCSSQTIPNSYKASLEYECKYGCKDGVCIIPEGSEEKLAPAVSCNLWCKLKGLLGVL